MNSLQALGLSAELYGLLLAFSDVGSIETGRVARRAI